MSRILTITLNPVIDKSTTVSSMVPEKKLRCSQPHFEPGGGGINVARAICKLGGTATAIYPYGGYSGQFLNTLLAAEGVPVLPVPVNSHTRENLIVVDTSSNNQYRFGMPGSPLTGEEQQACLDVVEQQEDVSFIVVSGSLPPEMPASVFTSFSQVARRKGARLVVDTSGDPLRQVVKEGVFLLKPNLGELSALLGRQELYPDEVPEAARELIRNGGCELVAVSMGAAGAMLVSRDGEVTAVAPPVKRKSTVGAGDSMVAGLVFKLAAGASYAEALRYGVACGTAATLNSGTELCRPEDVARLFPMIRVS